jgi:hypothetical protein
MSAAARRDIEATVREAVDDVLPLVVGERLLRERLANHELSQAVGLFEQYERGFAIDRPERSLSPRLRDEILFLVKQGLDSEIIRAHIASLDVINEQREIARAQAARSAEPTLERSIEAPLTRREQERSPLSDLERDIDTSRGNSR